MHRYEKRARSFYALLGVGTASPQLHMLTIREHVKSCSRGFPELGLQPPTPPSFPVQKSVGARPPPKDTPSIHFQVPPQVTP